MIWPEVRKRFLIGWLGSSLFSIVTNAAVALGRGDPAIIPRFVASWASSSITLLVIWYLAVCFEHRKNSRKNSSRNAS